MSRFRIEDAAPAELKGTRRTADGYLVAQAFVARPGIQVYLGDEVGMPDMPTVRVYRSEKEVRDANSLQSFSHAPVTMGHPAEDVTAANWKQLSVGEVSTEVTWKDNKISIPVMLKDADAISRVEAGTRELSPGYTAEIVPGAGVTPDGQPFDAQQVNIRVNHVAVVPKGRSGPEVRIGDSATPAHQGTNWGAYPIHDAQEEKPMATRIMLVDGLSVETTDAGAQAIEKLQGQLKTLADAKDTAQATADAEIERLKGLSMKDEDVAAMVASRADLLSQARTVLKDAIPATLSDADIRRKVVTAKLGDAAVAGKSDAYVQVRFDDMVAEAAKPAADPVLATVRDAAPGAAPQSTGSWDHVFKATGATA